MPNKLKPLVEARVADAEIPSALQIAKKCETHNLQQAQQAKLQRCNDKYRSFFETNFFSNQLFTGQGIKVRLPIVRDTQDCGTTYTKSTAAAAAAAAAAATLRYCYVAAAAAATAAADVELTRCWP